MLDEPHLLHSYLSQVWRLLSHLYLFDFLNLEDEIIYNYYFNKKNNDKIKDGTINKSKKITGGVKNIGNKLIEPFKKKD